MLASKEADELLQPIFLHFIGEPIRIIDLSDALLAAGMHPACFNRMIVLLAASPLAASPLAAQAMYALDLWAASRMRGLQSGWSNDRCKMPRCNIKFQKKRKCRNLSPRFCIFHLPLPAIVCGAR